MVPESMEPSGLGTLAGLPSRSEEAVEHMDCRADDLGWRKSEAVDVQNEARYRVCRLHVVDVLVTDRSPISACVGYLLFPSKEPHDGPDCHDGSCSGEWVDHRRSLR